MADGAMRMSEQYKNGPLRRGGGIYEVAELCFDLFFAKGLTIFQCAETVNNAGPLHVGTREGYLPGALWKDCERSRGRPGEVMSGLKTSSLGHGVEPQTPTPRHMHEWLTMHTHNDHAQLKIMQQTNASYLDRL